MAANAKSAHELSSEELDTVTGGSIGSAIAKGVQAGAQAGSLPSAEGGQSDPAQQFQQILMQLTQR